MPTARPSSLQLLDAIETIVGSLPRAGQIVKDPVFTTLEQEPGERFGFFHDLVEGNGVVLEAGGQDERKWSQDGSAGYEHILITLLTLWKPEAHGADASSHEYFARKVQEFEAQVGLPASRNLGGLEGVVHSKPPISPAGPYRLTIDSARKVHLCEFDWAIFTRSC